MNYAAFHSLHPKLSKSTYQPLFICVSLLTIKHMEMKTLKYMKLHNIVQGSAFLEGMISLRGLFVLRRLYLLQWILNPEVKLRFHNLDPFYYPSFPIFQMLCHRSVLEQTYHAIWEVPELPDNRVIFGNPPPQLMLVSTQDDSWTLKFLVYNFVRKPTFFVACSIVLSKFTVENMSNGYI